MAQMYEVFMDAKSVLLTDKPDIEAGGDCFLYLTYNDFEEIHYALELLGSVSALRRVVFFHENLQELFDDFRAHYKEIDAAGGVVVNPDDEVLLIHRRGKWDLPKGKVEPGEQIAEAALREVVEECGVVGLELGDHLLDTFHTYLLNGERILKRTRWYAMTAPRGSLVPQAIEDIDKAVWVKRSELDIDTLDTFDNVRKVLRTRLG